MDPRRIILDLHACLADCEWERATLYLSDLRAALERLIASRSSPRTDGAIVQSMAGADYAIEHHDARMAGRCLRHIAHLLEQRGDATPAHV
jgi:hypothetical protein